MKILYDYQILCGQRYGGISRYFYELANRITKKSEFELDCLSMFPQNYYFEAYYQKKSLYPYPPKTTGIILKLNKLNILLRNKNKYDIIHPTYYDPYILGKFNGKLVVTVYDMIHELFPDEFTSDRTTVFFKKKMIYAADKIIAISQSTKNDILKFYPDLDSDKIQVIYLGNSLKVKGNIKSEKRLKEDYILFVGGRHGYKNFKTFLSAFSKVASSNDISLLCVGGGQFSNEEREFISSLGLKDRVVHQTLNDEELAQAYSFAKCFVFPSKYEGFGIPILESFACNCPALLSNTSSLPEVGGDAALYFNPEDTDEIAQQISKVINDSKLRMKMTIKGQEQLRKFNWDLITDQTLNLYKSIM